MRRIIFCGIILAFLFNGASRAAVFERDWLAPGDGLLTYDDVNQREWLDLSETLLERFSDEPSDDIFDIEDEFQKIIAELEPGGLFDGFLVAMGVDVVALAQSAGVDTTTSEFEVNSDSVLALTELLGDTVNANNGGKFAAGFLDEFFDLGIPRCSPCRSGVILQYNPDSSINGRAGISVGPSSDFLATSRAGVMLYRQVPEPTTSILAASGLLIFSLLARRQCRNTRVHRSVTAMRTIALLIATACMLSGDSCAAVFQRDWKIPGDGLLTYDDVNQREWLDLTETFLTQFPGLLFEEQYQSVVDETLPGGLFAGFSVANSQDVINFAESAGIDTSTTVGDTNEIATKNITELLGGSVPAGRYALGFVDEISTADSNRLVAFFLNQSQFDFYWLDIPNTYI